MEALECPARQDDIRRSLSAAASETPQGRHGPRWWHRLGGMSLDGPSPMPAPAHFSGTRPTSDPVCAMVTFFLLRLQEGGVLPSHRGQAGHGANPRPRFPPEPAGTCHFCPRTPRWVCEARCGVGQLGLVLGSSRACAEEPEAAASPLPRRHPEAPRVLQPCSPAPRAPEEELHQDPRTPLALRSGHRGQGGTSPWRGQLRQGGTGGAAQQPCRTGTACSN